MRPICRLSASSGRSLATAIGSFVLCGFAVMAGPAQAADLGVPARSSYPPLPPAIYDWTGIYVGGHIGGGMLVDSVSQNGVSPRGFNLLSSGNLRPTGVIGGAQIGANYEFAPWVVGIEASWTDSAIDGNTLIGTTAGATFPQERFTSQAKWFAAVTGRVGYAANDCYFTRRRAAPGRASGIQRNSSPLAARQPSLKSSPTTGPASPSAPGSNSG